jgi:enoyl-CoA hydratase/carnithine racemase
VFLALREIPQPVIAAIHGEGISAAVERRTPTFSNS